jgi:hypothetical protein
VLYNWPNIILRACVEFASVSFPKHKEQYHPSIVSSLCVVCSQFHVTRAIEKHVDLDHGGREAKPTVKFNTTCFRVI